LILLEVRCDECVHCRRELVDGWKSACDAFPDGTPLNYLFDIDPAKLSECANGIGFEPIECAEASVIVASVAAKANAG
jgi:hypothetical protein